jgi:hypothetical protein
VTMHPRALHHMVVSFSLMPTFVFPAKPNNGITGLFGLRVAKLL